MKRPGRVFAMSCLLLLAPALQAGAPANDRESRRKRLDSRRQRIEAGIVAKLVRLERLGQEPGRAPARGFAPPPSVAEEGAVRTAADSIAVNCARNQSVSKAIARSRARYVRVEVSGTCAESVVVERSGVTISGTAAGGATIDPPDDVDGVPLGPAIRALGAHELVLEDLTLTGGLNGLDAIGSRQLKLGGVRAISNPGAGSILIDGYGVRLDGSEAVITNSELSANGRLMPLTGGPIVVMQGSHAEVSDSVMVDNPVDGPFSVYNSSLRITGCRMANNGHGPQAIHNSRTRVLGSTDNSGDHFAYGNSELTFGDATIANMLTGLVSDSSQLTYFRSAVETLYIVVERFSRLALDGSTVTGWCPFECAPGGGGQANLEVLYHSSAHAMGVPGVDSNFGGGILLDMFSDASFNTSEPIAGSVECYVRSRVFTNLPPAGGTSESCE